MLKHRYTLVILGITLLQGVLYLFLLPPWQHYDEPGHFEYAWLLAHHSTLFDPQPVVPAMRREIVASMLKHNFFWNLGQPSEDWWFPITQLQHPPLYYTLVSLPLRLIHHLDITTQLYVARSVSLLLFLATIAAALGTMRDLTPEGHILRWAVPLCMTLLPPCADLMTAVNSNVGGIACASLFLWGAVQTIRYGIHWQRVVWIVSAALLSTAMKNIAAFTILLIPLVLIFAWWVHRRWRWRWLVAGCAISCILGVAMLSTWGDAAYWYRWYGAETQPISTQARHDRAPLGDYVVVLEATSTDNARHLVNPLLHANIRELAGHTVTVGGWIWANQPARVSAPGIAYGKRAGTAYTPTTHPISVTTKPQFVAWTFAVPEGTQALHYVFVTTPAENTQTWPLYVFLDGAVLVKGTFPTHEAPLFDHANGHTGTWGGKPFTNLVRNSSAEHTWPRLQPWLGQTVLQFVSPGWGRTPSLLFAAALDIERTADIVQRHAGFMPLDSLASTFAWGHIRLTNRIWVMTFRLFVLLALVGCIAWFVRGNTSALVGLRPALSVLALAALLAWGSTYTRVLPKIGEGVVYPVARYTFGAMTPTVLMLIGGWWALWPRRWRTYATWALVGGTFILNSVAVWTIWTFYRSLPAPVAMVLPFATMLVHKSWYNSPILFYRSPN